ncbi:MAG: hypothetical protein FJX74_21555, partial [Armatimonadetes bacterium]|nr:hypothetical protein [Armatimonadota bacterium]
MLKLTLALAFGLSCLPLPAAENLAAGKPVALCPLPNEPTCTAGGTDLQDLTDGRLTQRADQCMWFETLAVGWSLVPVANVQIDLGAVRAIGEVALRFLGGSPQSGIEFPGFVKLLVSDDADAWYQVAEYSKWRPGDPERFGIPASAGKAWVHPLRFADLKTRGRYVGIALGGTGLVCSDEFYVYAGDHDPAAAAFTPEQAADFSVSRPQVAFVKPRLTLTSNLATPQPLVLLDGSGEKRPVTLHLEAPPGVQLLSGQVGDTAVTPSAAVNAAETTAQGTRYTVSLQTPGKSAFPWGKLWLRAELPPGTETSLRCRLEWNGGQSQALTVPATVIEIPPAPQCRRLMMALGWWPMADTAAWPGDGLAAA